jgi:isoamylase
MRTPRHGRQNDCYTYPRRRKTCTGKQYISAVRTLIKLRAEHPVFRRRRFLRCLPGADEAVLVRDDDGRKDVAWFTASGCPMDDYDWEAQGRAMAVFLNGDAITEPDPRGRRIVDDSFLVLVNTGSEGTSFDLPGSAERSITSIA